MIVRPHVQNTTPTACSFLRHKSKMCVFFFLSHRAACSRPCTAAAAAAAAAAASRFTRNYVYAPSPHPASACTQSHNCVPKYKIHFV